MKILYLQIHIAKIVLSLVLLNST